MAAGSFRKNKVNRQLASKGKAGEVMQRQHLSLLCVYFAIYRFVFALLRGNGLWYILIGITM